MYSTLRASAAAKGNKSLKFDVTTRCLQSRRSYHVAYTLSTLVYGSVKGRWNAVEEEYPKPRYDPDRDYQMCKVYSNCTLFFELAESWDSRHCGPEDHHVVRLIIKLALSDAKSTAMKNARRYNGIRNKTEDPQIPRLINREKSLKLKDFRELCWSIANCNTFYTSEPENSELWEDRAFHYLKWDLCSRLRKVQQNTDEDFFAQAHDFILRKHLVDSQTYNSYGRARETELFENNPVPPKTGIRVTLTKGDRQVRRDSYLHAIPIFQFSRSEVLSENLYATVTEAWQKKCDKRRQQLVVNVRNSRKPHEQGEVEEERQVQLRAPRRSITPAPGNNRREAAKRRSQSVNAPSHQGRDSPEATSKEATSDNRYARSRRALHERTQSELDLLRQNQTVPKKSRVRSEVHRVNAPAEGGHVNKARKGGGDSRTSTDPAVPEMEEEDCELLLPESGSQEHMYKYCYNYARRPMGQEPPPKWVQELSSYDLPKNQNLNQFAVELVRSCRVAVLSEALMGTNYPGGFRYYEFYLPSKCRTIDWGWYYFYEFDTPRLQHCHKWVALLVSMQYHAMLAFPHLYAERTLSEGVQFVRDLLLGNQHGGDFLKSLITPAMLWRCLELGKICNRPDIPRGDWRERDRWLQRIMAQRPHSHVGDTVHTPQPFAPLPSTAHDPSESMGATAAASPFNVEGNKQSRYASRETSVETESSYNPDVSMASDRADTTAKSKSAFTAVTSSRNLDDETAAEETEGPRYAAAPDDPIFGASPAALPIPSGTEETVSRIPRGHSNSTPMSGATSPVPSINVSKISEDARSEAGSHVTFSEIPDEEEEAGEEFGEDHEPEEQIETEGPEQSQEPEQYQSAEENNFEPDYEDTASQGTNNPPDIMTEDLNLSFDSTRMDQD